MQIDSRSEKIFSALTQKSLKWSSYFPVYDLLIGPYLGRTDVVLVEIGVMNGGSLHLWRTLLGDGARIIGVDLNPTAAAMRDHGFEIFIGDQSSPEFWRYFFARVGKVDILIDDGGHTNKHQITTVECCLDYIRDGGIIMVEDTHTSYMPQFGNPSRYSFMNYCKSLVDGIQARSSAIETLPMTRFASSVFSIGFYESMVCLHVDRRYCKPSKLLVVGHQEIGALNYWNADKRLVGFESARRGKRLLAHTPPSVQRFVTVLYNAIERRVTGWRLKLENRKLRRFFK